MNIQPDVLIIGAGVAGLTCALRLHEAGVSVKLLDAADTVGGRVQTDSLDGFLFDRGFQVFLSAYPEARRWLDFKTLDLKAFQPGAWSYFNGRFHAITDPLRMPWTLLQSLVSPVGNLQDKLRVFRQRLGWMQPAGDGIAPVERENYGNDWRPTHHWLDDQFSPEMIRHFWQPFLGGITLDASLSTPQWFTQFTMAMMTQGQVMLPARGMKTIPEQMAARLPADAIQLKAPVASLDVIHRAVTLTSGHVLKASKAVILATSWQERHRLLPNPEAPLPEFSGTTCLYYAADRPPLDEPVLVLNGSGHGLMNSLCVPSLVSPDYAPSGQSLISVSVLGTPGERSLAVLEDQVRLQLGDWFGRKVAGWQHLRTYRIPYALPRITTAFSDPMIAPGLRACGDYQTAPSLQGAMVAGRRCAEQFLKRS